MPCVNPADYHNSTDAIALLSMINNTPAFRFIVYRLRWELSDGKRIGQDPAGTFYYKSGYFEPGASGLSDGTKASFIVGTCDEGGVEKAHIKFYVPGSDQLLGEFVANDPLNRAKDWGKRGVKLEAAWKKVYYATAPATIFKAGDDSGITIRAAESLGKNGVVHSGDMSKYEIKNIEGQLTYKNITKLGNEVDWHRDRAVFYQQGYTTDFTAVFLPTNEKDQISFYDSGDGWGVSWSNA